MSSNSRTVVRRARVLAVALAVLAVLAAAVTFRASASTHAQATTKLTFSELDKGSTFVHIRNTPTRLKQSNQQGDLIVFTNPLADRSGKRIGTLHADCTTTVGARSFLRSTLTCVAVVALRDGTLTVQLISSPGVRTTAGAVTGGTGAYANARGVITSTHTDTGASDTVALVR